MTPQEMAAWRLQYRSLVAFRRRIRHRWPNPSEQYPPGNPLGAWCARQNRLVRQDRLPARCIRLLLQSGFPISLGASPWKPRQEDRIRGQDRFVDLFLWWLGLLRKFRKRHPSRWPKLKERFRGPHALGRWLGGIRREYRRGRLPAYKAALLERMDVPLQGPFAQRWEARFDRLKALLAEHPQDWRRTPEGRRLYPWVAWQRRRRLLGDLPPEQERLLEGLRGGFPAQDRWGEGFRRLAAYREAHPDRWPSGRDTSPDGFLLGKWCTGQRHRYRLGKLDPEQIRKLEGLGFPFKAWLQEAQWMEQYRWLETFRKLDPDRWPGNTEEFPPGNPLGKWCAQQRMDRNRKRLSPQRIGLLDRFGFPWETVKALQWMERFDELRDWRRRHPDRWPKNNAVDPGEKGLAMWVSNQKQFRKRGVLPEERLRELAGLGLRF
jgi:hypothetical protein